MANLEYGSFAGGMAQGVQDLGRTYLQTQMQMRQLKQQEAKAAQDASYRKVGIGFQMLKAVKDPKVKQQIFEQYIMAEADGVLDGLDLSEAFIDQAIKDLNAAYDARQKGDLNDQQLFEIYQRIRQEHPSSEAAKTAHEGLKGQIAQTVQRQEELRGFQAKGWSETEYPGAEEMRFPSLDRTLYAPPPEEEEPEKGFTLSPGQVRFGPKGKEIAKVKPKKEKPEYKPGQALEKIAAAQRAKATFDKTKQIDALMAGLFPEFKSMMGKKLSPEQVKRVNKSYDRLIKYLGKFAPKTGGTREQAIKQLQAAGHPITEKNITYVMDQLD